MEGRTPLRDFQDTGDMKMRPTNSRGPYLQYRRYLDLPLNILTPYKSSLASGETNF